MVGAFALMQAFSSALPTTQDGFSPGLPVEGQHRLELNRKANIFCAWHKEGLGLQTPVSAVRAVRKL